MSFVSYLLHKLSIIKKEKFDGNQVVNDENFKLDFKGLADFSSERNDFNFIANVDYADFKSLNFVNDSVSVFKGNVRMDITGNNLDNISGEVKFQNTIYQNKNDSYRFDDFWCSRSTPFICEKTVPRCSAAALE